MLFSGDSPGDYVPYKCPPVLWHCCLGIRKSVQPVKIEWWGVVICLERGADSCTQSNWCHCHPKTQSSLASFKSRLVLPFWNQVVLEKRPLGGCSISRVVYIPSPSVLWRCWLGGRKGIRPVKTFSGGLVGYWHGYLSGARCRLAYCPADATATHCLLLQ